MLNNLDKLFREIEIITSASRDALESSLLSSTQGTYGDGVTVHLKKRPRSSSGEVLDNSTLIIDTIRLASWEIITLNNFFSEWESRDYNTEMDGFDGLLFDDNNYSSTVTYDDKEITTPATISLIKFSKILFANVQNLALYDVETNINDNTVSDLDGNFNAEIFKIGSDISREIYRSNDDFIDYANNFSNSGLQKSVSYWISLIRNHYNPEMLVNSILKTFEIRNPSYDVNKSTDEFNRNIQYISTSEWYDLYSMGIAGDNLDHSLGGYHWNFLSDSISTGINSRAQGINSLTLGYMANAIGDNSLAVHNNVSNDINSSVFGIGNIAQREFNFSTTSPKTSVTTSCVSNCSFTASGIRKTIEIKIEGEIAQNNFNSSDGTNGIYLYDLVTFNGENVKKAIKGNVQSIDTYSDDTGNQFTILEILTEYSIGFSIASGKISRYTPVDSFVKSKFILGQYNNPNESAIFQIGTGTSESNRDTFVELGFNNSGFSNTYFKIGLDTVDSVIDYLRVEGNLVNFTLGESVFKLSEPEIRFQNTDGGSIVIDNQNSTMELLSTSSTSGLTIDNTGIRLFNGDTFLNINENLVIQAESYININGGAETSYNAGNSLILTWKGPTIGDSIDTNIIIGSSGSDGTLNNTFASEKLSLYSKFANYNLSSYNIFGDTSLDISGDNLDVTISGERLEIDSYMNLFNKERYGSIFGKKTSLTKMSTSAGFVDYYNPFNNTGYLMLVNKNPRSSISNDSNATWSLAGDFSDNQLFSSIYYDGLSSSIAWKKIAYSDEVSKMGRSYNYDAASAFAVFNTVDNEDVSPISTGKVSNFSIITSNNDLDTIKFDQDATSSTTVKMSIDNSNIPYPYVSIKDVNDENTAYNIDLNGVLHASNESGSKLVDGSLFIEWSLFSKVGKTIYFDISVRQDISTEGLYTNPDSPRALLFVMGQNVPELVPETEFSRRLIFQEQNKSNVNYRHSLRIVPFNKGDGIAFIISRNDNGRIYPYSYLINEYTNASGAMGAFRSHFRGHYYARNEDSIPYL